MKRHQDSFKTQSETGRNGDKIDTHNTDIHDHSLCSMQYDSVKLAFCTKTRRPCLMMWSFKCFRMCETNYYHI